MEAELIERVTKNKNAIKSINQEQTLAICEAAFAANKSCFKLLHYQSDEMCRQAIIFSPLNIRHVINQTEELCNLAFDLKPAINVFKYMKYQNHAQVIKMVARNLKYIEHVNEITIELCAYLQERMLLNKCVFDRQLSTEVLTFLLEFSSEFYQNYQYKTYETDLLAVNINYSNIMFVIEQTNELCTIAYNKNPISINYIDNQNKFLQSLNNTDDVGKYICSDFANIDDKFILANIAHIYYFFYVKNLKLEHVIKYINHNPQLLQMLDNLTELEYVDCIMANIDVFPFIENKTVLICCAALSIDGKCLKYIENQIEDICKIALVTTPESFKYVKEKTTDLCILYINECIKQNTHIEFKLLPQQSCNESVYELLLNNDYDCFKYIKNPSDYLIELSIKLNVFNIFYVKNKTEAHIKLAIDLDCSLVKCFKNYIEYATQKHGLNVIKHMETIDDLVRCYRSAEFDYDEFVAELQHRTQRLTMLKHRFCMLSLAQLNNSNAKCSSH